MRATAFAMLLIASLATGLLASSAHAAAPEVAASPDVSGWVGRYCPPTGCADAASSPVAHAASFGVAAAAIAFLARRRRA